MVKLGVKWILIHEQVRDLILFIYFFSDPGNNANLDSIIYFLLIVLKNVGNVEKNNF